jgi:hypothetical protein
LVLTKDFIPIPYIIRQQELSSPDATYESKHQRLVAVSPLQGYEFKHDNGIIFDFPKSWTVNGPAYPWMIQYSNSRNGRAAWLAMLAYYEGIAKKHIRI